MSDKYPCETCEHYRPLAVFEAFCSHPDIKTFCWRVRRYSRIEGGCGNGRRHSGYVSVWRRAWRWLGQFAPRSAYVSGMRQVKPVVKPEFDFENNPPTRLRHLDGNETDARLRPLSNIEKVRQQSEPREAGLWRDEPEQGRLV